MKTQSTTKNELRKWRAKWIMNMMNKYKTGYITTEEMIKKEKAFKRDLTRTLLLGGIFLSLAVLLFLTAQAKAFNLSNQLTKPLEFGLMATDDSYLDRATEMIASHEGFNPKCYKDGNGYSQGYGHKCLGGKISQERSKEILKNEVKRLDDKVREGWKPTQRVGIISFLYNHPVNQRTYVNWLNHDAERFQSMLEYRANNHVYINGQRFGGLLVRRAEEWELIYNTF